MDYNLIFNVAAGVLLALTGLFLTKYALRGLADAVDAGLFSFSWKAALGWIAIAGVLVLTVLGLEFVLPDDSKQWAAGIVLAVILVPLHLWTLYAIVHGVVLRPLISLYGVIVKWLRSARGSEGSQ